MKLNPPTGTDTAIEADHRKLKSVPWPMRDLKRFRSAQAISEGHALNWTFSLSNNGTAVLGKQFD